MTTGVADALFVDTNVLVFSSVAQAPLHAAARDALHSMVAHRVSRLLTHNVQDFNRFSALITIVPLVGSA